MLSKLDILKLRNKYFNLFLSLSFEETNNCWNINQHDMMKNHIFFIEHYSIRMQLKNLSEQITPEERRLN